MTLSRPTASRKAPILVIVAGQLDDVVRVSDVEDAAAEDVGHALELLAPGVDRTHLGEHDLGV